MEPVEATGGSRVKPHWGCLGRLAGAVVGVGLGCREPRGQVLWGALTGQLEGLRLRGVQGQATMGPGALAVAGVSHRESWGQAVLGPPWQISWSRIRP